MPKITMSTSPKISIPVNNTFTFDDSSIPMKLIAESRPINAIAMNGVGAYKNDLR